MDVEILPYTDHPAPERSEGGGISSGATSPTAAPNNSRAEQSEEIPPPRLPFASLRAGCRGAGWSVRGQTAPQYDAATGASVRAWESLHLIRAGRAKNR
jgi:hypothetical protein